MVRVAIADDSEAIRERIKAMVSLIPGVEVVGEAIDGVETAIMVHKIKPDVLILDLQMPKLSGLEILSRVKETVPTPIVVVLTNFSTSPLKAMCLQKGADYFFDKSTEFEKAIALIEKIAVAPASAC